MIQNVVKAHASERLGKPDYALRSAGGRILRYGGLTSKIYVDEFAKKSLLHSVDTSVGAWLQNLVWPDTRTPRIPISATPPDVVIDGQYVRAGRCWSFAGDKGVLTVLLARPVALTTFGLEHVPRITWPDHASAAPKLVEVWGLSLPVSYRQLLDSTGRRAANDEILLKYVLERFKQTIPSTYSTARSSISPASKSVDNLSRLLAKFEYGTEFKDFDHQTVLLSNSSDNELVDVIQMRVVSNWGNPEYTCVYRLGAH
jgi:hypothetical protein